MDSQLNLESQFLLANPRLDIHEIYGDTLLYVYEQTQSYVRALIINKPLNVSLQQLMNKQYGSTLSVIDDMVVYDGGPYHTHKTFACFSDDYVHFRVSASKTLLRDIAEGHGPLKSFLFMGCCEWSLSSLMNDLYQDNWMVIPGVISDVMRIAPCARREYLLKHIGVDLNYYFNFQRLEA